MFASIRHARDVDAAQIATVHVTSWQVAYRGIIPENVLNRLSVSDRRAMWENILTKSAVPEAMTLVAATDDDRVVGFIHARVYDTSRGRTAEVLSCYVLPERWRSGFGAALLRASVGHLRRLEANPITLWVLEENAQGRCFYEALDWSLTGSVRTIEIGGSNLREVEYAYDPSPPTA